MQNIVTENLQHIKDLMLCYGVEHAYVFGSAAKGSMNEASDVDFVVRFPRDMHFKT